MFYVYNSVSVRVPVFQTCDDGVRFLAFRAGLSFFTDSVQFDTFSSHVSGSFARSGISGIIVRFTSVLSVFTTSCVKAGLFCVILVNSVQT